jgi:flagellar M-ring protein FliF
MFEETKNNWAQTGASKKIFLVGGVVVVLALFVFLTMWALKDDYQVLFADLDPQDAAQMVAELDRLKTPYKLADNGTTILVEQEAVYKTRLKLMGKGLTLRGNVGFELFNNTDYGTTEFAQKINFQRALQGELARTIMDIEEIKFARVHLVLPDRGLLKRNNGRAKASITLAMKGDTPLSSQQVIGIQRLVAAAVPEMEANAVTVIDQKGVALTPNVIGDSSGAWTTANIEVKKEIESYLTKKVSAMLDGALGPGKALVSIDVALNHDAIKVTKEEIVPPTERRKVATVIVPPLLPAEQGVVGEEETSKTGLALAADIAAREMGIPAKSKSAPIESQNGGRRVEQIVSEPGNIRRISVGILVPAGFGEQRLAQLREVVGMAVGLNVSRGDAIAIQSVEPAIVIQPNFAPEANATAAQESKPAQISKFKPFITDSLWYWLVGGALLLIVLGAFGLAMRRQDHPASKRSLTSAEREKMLRQISEWVAAGTVKQSVVEKV